MSVDITLIKEGFNPVPLTMTAVLGQVIPVTLGHRHDAERDGWPP
jgi:hypothetical protein